MLIVPYQDTQGVGNAHVCLHAPLQLSCISTADLHRTLDIIFVLCWSNIQSVLVVGQYTV